MGKGKIENATIGKMEVEEKDAVDAILDKVTIPDGGEYRIIDKLLDEEIVGRMRGHFRPELVYNMPFASDKGSVSCRECDLVKGGCWYKEHKVKHTHVCGVGYLGSLTAMRSYGMLKAYVEERPEVVEEGGILYWAAYAEVTDGHNGNGIGRWYFQPVLMKAGKGYKENEHAASIAQSKALRNCILALIPHDLIDQWLEDYRSGKQPFDPERTKEKGYDKQTAATRSAPRRKPKSEPEPAGKSDQLIQFIKDLAKKRDLTESIVDAWVEMREETTARNTLFLNRCINDDAAWAEAEADYKEFEKKFLKDQEAAKGTEELFDKKGE